MVANKCEILYTRGQHHHLTTPSFLYIYVIWPTLFNLLNLRRMRLLNKSTSNNSIINNSNLWVKTDFFFTLLKKLISRSTKKKHLITLKEKHCKSYHKNIHIKRNKKKKRKTINDKAHRQNCSQPRKNIHDTHPNRTFVSFYLDGYKLAIRVLHANGFPCLLDDPYLSTRCLTLSHHFDRVNAYVAMNI